MSSKAIASLLTRTAQSRFNLAVADFDAIADHIRQNFNAILELRRHPRARNLTLRVNSATRKVVATIPQRASRREAASLVLANYTWIAERLAKAPIAQPLADGSEIPLRGQIHRIRFMERTTARGVVTTVQSDENQPELHVVGRIEHCPRRLKDWLVKTAKSDLEARTTQHATQLGVRFKRISVRDQSSRWGSCSTSGTLSFSWRLILAPPDILDYVAAHEVAHLKEMNHSPAFWSLVAKLCPDFKTAETWLTNEGPQLHSYCPTATM